MKKYFKVSKIEGLRVLSGGTCNVIISFFDPLDLDEYLKNKILVEIENRRDFSIAIHELKYIKEALTNYLNALLVHPDFDPVKTYLRERYPLQFEHCCFEFEGARYYVRSKHHPLDSKINSFHNFYRLVDAHIRAQKKIEFTFY